MDILVLTHPVSSLQGLLNWEETRSWYQQTRLPLLMITSLLFEKLRIPSFSLLSRGREGVVSDKWYVYIPIHTLRERLLVYRPPLYHWTSPFAHYGTLESVLCSTTPPRLRHGSPSGHSPLPVSETLVWDPEVWSWVVTDQHTGSGDVTEKDQTFCPYDHQRRTTPTVLLGSSSIQRSRILHCSRSAPRREGPSNFKVCWKLYTYMGRSNGWTKTDLLNDSSRTSFRRSFYEVLTINVMSVFLFNKHWQF